VLVDEIDRAFPDHQAGGTRLVLTQSTYLLQKWIDQLDPRDQIVATADRRSLEEGAPEFLQRRGRWSAFEVVDLDRASGLGGLRAFDEASRRPATASFQPPTPGPLATTLARAYAAADPAERLRLCREAVTSDAESAVAHLALASAYRESRDLAARDALDRAAALAPEWEAVHYESGKLWLALDDLERARDAFARAGELMPSFSAAFSNLGATLGELDRPDAALAAFEQALTSDPASFTILNNIGVVNRELGRFDVSESVFRRVVAIAPAFVFGHYNLGHTLFLAGRYAEAVRAYEEGQRRDPEPSRRQGCRLAVVRLATGDAAGAERDLWRAANDAPPDEREDLLLEAYEILLALIARHPELSTHQPLVDRIGAEIIKSE
jgi:tetratricopeptide (TPR) repeat protein